MVDRVTLPGMTVQAAWTPESGRPPTDEELLAYAQAQVGAEVPDAITEPYVAPADIPVDEPDPDLPPWTPESGRPPTDEELLAYAEYEEPTPAPPEPEPERRPTPEEELRETPGITGLTPTGELQTDEWRQEQAARIREAAGEEPLPPPPEPERIEITEPLRIEAEAPEPWDPNSGVAPTDEQLAVYAGLDPELIDVAAPTEPVEVNPVVLPAPGEDLEAGRLRTYSSRVARDFTQVLSGVPKAVQLWFAPDTELLDWMDEMDRIDAMPEGVEKFDAQVQHISRGMQKYGTLANVHSNRFIDMYVEGPENKGEKLAENRRKARAQFTDELRKTIERPLYRAGETMDQTVRDYFPTNPEYQDEFMADVFGGLGSMAGFMVSFAATRRLTPLPKVPPTTRLGQAGVYAAQAAPTAGLGITIQQSMAFENALREGADIDVAFDAAYSPYTTIAGASEVVPIANFLTRADKMAGGEISKAIRRMVIQGTEEGIQEGFQAVMENLTAQDLYDPERQLWTGIERPAAVGFTTGAIVEFLGSLIPGRRRAMRERAGEQQPGDLEAQLDAARAEVAAAGGDALDQAEAASAVMADQAPDVAATKERILAEREARAERAEAGEGIPMAPLAELAQAEARLARAGFDERAAMVGEQVSAKIAEQQERMFAEREAEQARAVEAERQEAEVQRAEQETVAQEEVAEAVEAQEVAPTTIAEAIEPEARAGLERMRAALAAEAEPVAAPEPEVVEEAPPALPAPAMRVTPEGEVLTPEQAAAREEERETRRLVAEEEGRVERPFEVETMEAMAQQPALPAERATEDANAIIDAKANQAATSPLSDAPTPTQGQLETGQYQKGELGPQDLDMPGVKVAIENPKGTVRSGPGWQRKMRDHYGFIRGTESAEGPREQLDAFIGDQPDSPMVFVVDQIDQNTGQFDEHKVMIGYANQMDAVRGYKRNYSRGWKVGPVTAMTKEQFTRWLERGDQTQPVNQQLRETMPLAGEAAFAEEVEAARVRARADEPVIRFRVEGEAEPTEGQVRIPSASVAANMLGPIPAVPKPKSMTPEEQQTAMEEERTAKDMEKVTAAPETVVNVSEARESVKPLLTELVQLRPRILASPEDAPTDLNRALRARGALRAKGAFFDGQLYVFANNHTNVDDISRTILHEGVAHQGLRALYKDESILNDLLDDVYAGMSDADIEAMRARARAYADLDLSKPEDQRELAEEHIAHLAETDPQQGMVKRFVASIRQLLRAAGLDLQYNNDDIVAILRDARRELRQVVPLERINVVSQVEVAETGEIIEVEEQADIALRQLDKRQGVIETLRGCLA